MSLENFNNQEINVEKIKAPEGSYFIHGLKTWSAESSVGIYEPEISCSLQFDSKTKPIRPFGYILEIDKGGIAHAFDRDTTSTINENDEKMLTNQSPKLKDYPEDNLLELLDKTQNGGHNEIWVRGISADIVGAYVAKNNREGVAGIKKFMKACRDASLSIHIIETDK